MVSVARGAGPDWSMMAARSGRLSQAWKGGAELSNVVHGADSTWSMMIARARPDLVNVGRAGADLVNGTRGAGPGGQH